MKKIIIIGIAVLGVSFAGLVYAMPQQPLAEENTAEDVAVIDLSHLQEEPLASPEVEPIYEEPKPQIVSGTSVQISSSRSCVAKGDCPLTNQEMEKLVELLTKLVESLRVLVSLV